MCQRSHQLCGHRADTQEIILLWKKLKTNKKGKKNLYFRKLGVSVVNDYNMQIHKIRKKSKINPPYCVHFTYNSLAINK